MTRHSPLIVLRSLLLLLLIVASPRGFAADGDRLVQLPEGGRLDALDEEGNILGPCPLKHTAVNVEISGHFTRVSLTQTYQNPYETKIEAVYSFPMSHRAAVDRMTMTVGNRVIEGEVKERELARQMYAAARAAGHVASLLEQERPNIFTQSVANIEPGREVVVNISYVELLQAKDGEYTFDFPMVVGPRYIPGSPTVSPAIVPAEIEVRRGLILLGPAKLTVGRATEIKELGTLQTGKLHALLTAAQPIKMPGEKWFGEGDDAKYPDIWYQFEAEYCDGSKDLGTLFVDGTGEIDGRWFFTDPKVIQELGTGFAQDTNQVPDASRITPEPVRPGTRAGHDISVTVLIDTGGIGITRLVSDLHEIDTNANLDDMPARVKLALKNETEIPNRDFVLRWSLASEAIHEAILTHTTGDAAKGNFFSLILEPPARVDDAVVRPRELVFVMDTSGSMNGYPIAKSKEVMHKALNAMRQGDTFNVITFAGSTQILWPKPRPNTAENRAEALNLIDNKRGSGGTEMMTAINAALIQTAPPETRHQKPMRIVMFLTDGYVGNDMAIVDAIRKNAASTRVFSFGIGNSVNRFLLDGMARAGRGESEFVLLESDADEAVERFTRRVQTPVLTDIELIFSDGLGVADVLPGTHAGQIPDLFDVKPLVVHGRYLGFGPGTVTIRGNTAEGPWERIVAIDFPREAPDHDTIATLWARAKIDDVLNRDLAAVQSGSLSQALKEEVIALGETFQIMSQYTSFIAIEKARVTIGGEPMLIAVPIEMPDGVSYEGIFGDGGQVVTDEGGDLALGLHINAAELNGFDDRELAKGENVAGFKSLRLAENKREGLLAFSKQRDNFSGPYGPRTAGRKLGQLQRGELADAAGRPSSNSVQFSWSRAPARGRTLNESLRRSISTLERRIAPGGGGGGGLGGGGGGGRDVDQAGRADTPTGRELLEALFGDADQKLFNERLCITLAAFVELGHADAAAFLVDAMLERDKENELALRMKKILDDETLDDAERTAAFAELASEMEAIVQTHLQAPIRHATLVHRLDPRLLPFAEGNGFPDTLVDIYNGPTPADARWMDGGIVVSVLFEDMDDENLAQLAALGARVLERFEDAEFALCILPLGRFDDVGLLEGVRRVEVAVGGD